MAEQDEWRPLEMQSEPSLPIPPKAGVYHEGLQTLWSHLEQLVREGRLQHLLYYPNGQEDQSRLGA